jgi:hypothetical protein
MTTSIRQAGQFAHVGLNLGKLQNVSSYTTVLGGTHLTARCEHGTVQMDKDEAISWQRELLAALAVHGYRPDISGACADIKEEG